MLILTADFWMKSRINAISQLGDNPGLPLLFGVTTLKWPYRFTTQFHGEAISLNLIKALKKLSLFKSRMDMYHEKHFPSSFTST